ncbi:hypothetical protein EJ04DRAFT_578037 [Polyplosphaeria fusca]|uniref:Uncharacterized protein n=1 Tax=Polyplosphaeria fusca TaxID=682080 RepID=A0A9P4QXF3_9PLEO|nr:hypothetical protein EJ04DRAFT_578037 [Polyplosphaeria fusca]
MTNTIPDPQSESALFRLPAELRNCIYEFACTLDMPVFDAKTGLIECTYNADPCHTLNLLLTCRLISSELDRSLIPEHNTAYCRDDVVSAVTDYYKFLINFYLHDSLQLAPAGSGWTNITPLTLKKTDAVIDLVRHLPYFIYFVDIYPYTKPVRYGSISSDSDRGGMEICHVVGPGETRDADEYRFLTPEHVVTIAEAEHSEGCFILFDTHRGTLTLVDVSDGVVGPISGGLSQELEELADEGEILMEKEGTDGESWREWQTYYCEEFFERLQTEFRNLEVIPHSHHEVRYPSSSEKSEEQQCRIFMQRNGWPDQGWVKDELIMKTIRKIWDPEASDGENNEE